MFRQPVWIILLVLAFLALPACDDTPDDDDTVDDDDDDDTVDDDDDSSVDDDDSSVDDDDSAPPPLPPPPGSTLCASGGPVNGAGITGVVCTGPVDLASGAKATSASGDIVWHPGPIRRIAP